MLKKADIVLFFMLLILGISSWIFLEQLSFGKGEVVKVYLNNKLYGTYNLNVDKTIEINHKNHINKITIKDSRVAIVFSNCKGKDCVHMGFKSKPKESIVCLPNRVMVEIEGKGDIDGISK